MANGARLDRLASACRSLVRGLWLRYFARPEYPLRPSTAVLRQRKGCAASMLRNREVNVLFTVDLFNEGVDIPEIDCVFFLRPTESSTVFFSNWAAGFVWTPARPVAWCWTSSETSGVSFASTSGSLRSSAVRDSRSSERLRRGSRGCQETATSASTRNPEESYWRI